MKKSQLIYVRQNTEYTAIIVIPKITQDFQGAKSLNNSEPLLYVCMAHAAVQKTMREKTMENQQH